MGAVVVAEGLGKSYGSGRGEPVAEALSDVSFALPSGSFTALLGPSGCGKSTLLNILGALDVPTAGRVRVDGKGLAGLSEGERDLYRRETVSTVFQFFNLLPTMTALENVALPLLLAGGRPADAAERARAGLADVGLAEKARSFPYELSGGQVQRVAVARALVTRPRLLLADEPTGNLDSKAGAQVLDLVSGLVASRGITVVMATHSQTAAARAGSVLRLLDGRLVDGPA